MMKRKFSIIIITILIASLIIPTYFAFVSSSSGYIKINTTGSSTPGQQVQAGGNVSLYFGNVNWDDVAFYLTIGKDSSNTMIAGDLVYTPAIDVYNMSNTATKVYTGEFGTWTVGYGWVNGTIPMSQVAGNCYIKAIDGKLGSPVAITETYLSVTAANYSSTLNISPLQGTGGTPITFTGSGWPGNQVDIYYNDPSYGWKYLASTTPNGTGQISYTCEAPDLMRSNYQYDQYYEQYTSLSFKAQTPSSLIYSGTVSFNEYFRGLKTVGNATASGLFGNSTDLSENVKVKQGDVITISGKWFHAGSPIYIKWDSQSVVGTVTGEQWASKPYLASTAANANGSFSTTITIPDAEAGSHYVSVEDSQTRLIVKISLCIGTLDVSPNSGAGGRNVDITGTKYPAGSTVELQYLDTATNTWRFWTSTTATANGTISFSTEIPDIHVSNYGGQYSNSSATLSFKAKVNGVAYAYANYYQFGRGLTQIGNYVPYVLFGNGTDVSNNVNLRPGDSLYLAGKYFHPGPIYVRFDGKSSTSGQSYIATRWTSSISVGSTTASDTGTFAINVIVPTVYDGVHSIAIEDSETSTIVNIYVTGEKEPAATPNPTATANPTTSPTNSPSPILPTPDIDLTCKGTSTSSQLQAEISGRLTLNGQAVNGAPIRLSYSKNGGNSFESLTLVNTASDGSFSAVWLPDATGNYLIKATSEATSNMNDATTIVNLALDKDSSNTVFTVNSNSTITEFAFNSTSKQLSFLASGPSNTHGYVEVYMPKSLVSDISQLTAYIDGRQIDFSSRSQGDSWIITFTYSHSQHLIIMAISGNTVQPSTDFSGYLIYVAIAAIVVVAVSVTAVALTKRKK